MNELFVYQTSFPFKPDLIEIKRPNSLVLSKKEGIPYLDVNPFTEIMITTLAKTISSFHSVVHLDDKVLCHWDNQPRNILWDEKQQKFWLLDFEDIRLAFPEADLTHLFLFWAEVMSHEVLKRCVNSFLNSYHPFSLLNKVRWKRQFSNSRLRFDRRRNKYNKKEPVRNPDRLNNRKYLSNLTFNN